MIGIIDVIGIMSVPGVTVTVTDVDSFIGTTGVIVSSTGALEITPFSDPPTHPPTHPPPTFSDLSLILLQFSQ